MKYALVSGGRGDCFSGMSLENYEKTDPHLLVGLVNTELRNHSESLEDLCKTHGIDEATLVTRLTRVPQL